MKHFQIFGIKLFFKLLLFFFFEASQPPERESNHQHMWPQQLEGWGKPLCFCKCTKFLFGKTFYRSLQKNLQ